MKYLGEFADLAKQVKSKYPNKVDFITISVDKIHAYHEWKYSLAHYEIMSLENLIDFEGDFMYNNYKFTGVPRYLLIDPDGKLITTALLPPYSKAVKNYIVERIENYFKEK